MSTPDSTTAATTANGTFFVLFADIVAREEWQVRSAMDGGTVQRYATAMRGGEDMPPVVIARIDGALYLVDGWHRMKAAKLNGAEGIMAVVSDMSEEEARLQAALANLRHGRPLTGGERRNVFKAYVGSGAHRKGRGYKSYRDIEADLAHQVTYGTVRNWMEQDFPSVFRRMGGGVPLPENGGERPLVPTITPLDSAKASLDQAAAEAQRLSEADRLVLLAHMREVAKRVREGTARVLEEWEENPDF